MISLSDRQCIPFEYCYLRSLFFETPGSMLELPSMGGELVEYLSITNFYLVVIAFCWRTFPLLQTNNVS